MYLASTAGQNWKKGPHHPSVNTENTLVPHTHVHMDSMAATYDCCFSKVFAKLTPWLEKIRYCDLAGKMQPSVRSMHIRMNNGKLYLSSCTTYVHNGKLFLSSCTTCVCTPNSVMTISQTQSIRLVGWLKRVKLFFFFFLSTQTLYVRNSAQTFAMNKQNAMPHIQGCSTADAQPGGSMPQCV